MKKVISKDGTTIAYDQLGHGSTVILVGGAFSYRLFPGSIQLAELLAQHFTVINYDRRGRGDSDNTLPYSVEREIEDLEALIKEAGGSASVWGMSSGAVLALRAAASGLNIKKLSLYQPPFILDNSRPLPPANLVVQLNEMISLERRSDAVKFFMKKAMGVPAIFVTMLRLMPKVWHRLKAVAHTLPYDYAIMGDTVTGKPLSAKHWASVTMPTLVIGGGKSPSIVQNAVQAIVKVLPNGQQHTLEGQSHNVSMKVLAPVLVEFFTEKAEL
jgi:pimeloyl-ACP methyl ester carboxylesterase